MCACARMCVCACVCVFKFEKVKTWFYHALVFTEDNSLMRVKFLLGKFVTRLESLHWTSK